MRIHGIGGLVSNWSADGTRATLERLSQEGKLDFVWHVGDIGYLDDSYAHEPLKFTYESDYNGYMNWLQNLSSAIPYMVLPGNHESECHSPACIANPHLGLPLKNFSAFNARWHMPSAASGGRMNMWYSFNVGNIHFVSINTETDFPGAGEENKGDSGVAWLTAGHFGENGEYLRWLEADLRAAAAERTNGGRQWILAGGHKPMFALKGSGIVELMEKYGVDVYFAGHIHSYFRSPPSTQGKVNRSGILSDSHYRTGYGIVEIVAGGAGCDEMALQAQKMTQEGSCEHGAVPGSDYCLVPVREGLPPLGAFPNAAVNTSAVSLGVLDSVNERTLHWRLIGSTTGHLLDDLMITRGDEAPEMPATRVLV